VRPISSRTPGISLSKSYRVAVDLLSEMRSACSVSIAHSANPRPPSGSAGSSGLATTDLALATVTRVKRQNSEVTILRLFAFYGNNAVVAVPSSETTEPNIYIKEMYVRVLVDADTFERNHL
jgi:hypothetical protein